jgi:hypothetical protein
MAHPEPPALIPRDLAVGLPAIPENINVLHHAVMSFMNPGRADGRRSFLFALDPVAEQSGEAVVIIRSASFPADLPARPVSLPRPGQSFEFALRGLPQISRKGRRTPLLRPEEQADWMLREAAKAGFVVTDLDEPVPTRRVLLRQGVHSLLNDVVFLGLGTLVEADAFRRQIALGLGRGRAYGYGLLRFQNLS